MPDIHVVVIRGLLNQLEHLLLNILIIFLRENECWKDDADLEDGDALGLG